MANTFKVLCNLLIVLALPKSIKSFSSNQLSTHTDNACDIHDLIQTSKSHPIPRGEFLSTVSKSSLISLLPIIGTTVGTPQPALARGRATLEFSYDRYTPRIIAGGEFYSKDLKNIIGKNDWSALKAATSDPPKKSKEDRSKPDGGIAERAALAGGFSDARVLIAADLYAAAFSDNSISPKTKKMKAKVDILRETVEQMNSLAKEALGEEKEGGFFGLGAKKRSQAELSKIARELYVKGGNAWNEYIFEANDELEIKLARLPYL